MSNPSRPTQLPRCFLAGTLVLFALSFASGMLVWWGQGVNAGLDPGLDGTTPPFPVHFWLTLHGVINPLLCVALGYLLCHHVPVGWRMRANRWTGIGMLVVFSVLIGTGVGLYYSGGEDMRSALVVTHRGVGLLLPLMLGAHWMGAARWARTR